MARDTIIQRTDNPCFTEMAPYRRTATRHRKGLRHTAFYPVIGRVAREFKLHNSFFKPDRITDPLDEYWTMRRNAGLWDVTGEEVIEIAGDDALEVMNSLVPRDLTRLRDGHCLYSVMCYGYGGIVEDAVLVRFNARRFWWVGGPGSSEQWIYSQALGRAVTVTSFLNEKHVASLQGPKSRELLQAVVPADLSRFPFYGMVETEVCGVGAVITRTGFTAELGYDIYVDVPVAQEMFARLWDDVRKAGVKLCGSRALNLRRIEAGIINFGQDFDWQHTPFQVGLGWMVNDRKGFFHGRDALRREGARNPSTRLAGLRLEGREAAAGGDKVVLGNTEIGLITSAILSPTLDESIAMAFLSAEASRPGQTLSVMFDDRPVKATVVPIPFFDPERKLSKVP
jgi:glycine cleavage system T protein (aminomethyltransferase)